MSASERRSLPADLRARVLAEAARTPAPTRRQHRARALVSVAAGALATAALFFGAGGFAPGGRPAALVAFSAGLGLVAALVLTRVSSDARGSMLGRPRPVLLLASAAATPALALVALAAAGAWPEHAVEEIEPQAHLGCGLVTLAQGAALLAALLVPRRGSDPIHPALTGAALGVTAGAWTAALAYLRCPHVAAAHCVAAHALPTLALGVAGAVVGRALLRLR